MSKLGGETPYFLTYGAYIRALLYNKAMFAEVGGWTFAVGLLTFVTKFDVDWGQMTAAAVLALIPVCVFFGLVQRSLVSGLTAGAIKG